MLMHQESENSYKNLAFKLGSNQYCDQPDVPTESSSGNIGLDSGAFLLTTKLFERTNQIVACPVTWVANWHPSTCADANW